MKHPPFATRGRVPLLLLDAALFACAWAGAYFIRFDLMSYPSAWQHFRRTVLVLVAVKVAVLVLAGTYRGLLRYASIPDLLVIVRNCTLASVVFLVSLIAWGYRPYSRGALVIDWMLSIGLLATSRLAWRVFRDGLVGFSRASRASRKHVLIVGAGRAGAALAKDLMAERRGEIDVIGFVDDDPDKQGSTLLGLPILGTTHDLGEIPRRRPVDQVVIAIPSAPPRVLRKIAERVAGVTDVRVVPPLEALLRGKAAIVQSVPVPDDIFLTRRAVDLSEGGVRRFLEGKTVLVTGAGGSIGGELVRQLAQRGQDGLRRLVLLDCAETPLHEIYLQTSAALGPRARPVLASVRDVRRMADVLEAERPDVILHAAALKHVPMCETHVLEAIATNTVSTARLADLARRHRVAHFTLVSTDKAVAPACAMGASKRGAEIYIQSLARSSQTRFAAVRFGNVLGSNGSVLPLFHSQIANGGPVTVTDPRATRFFMTIPEACGLILQATRIARSGEIYVLDMGEPIRVLDLAHNLIRLYGYEPGRDIEVRIIGLRPGEKLHESLVDEGEVAERLGGAKLLRIRSRGLPRSMCREVVAKLERCLRDRDETGAMRLLHSLVPTFHPALAGGERLAVAAAARAPLSDGAGALVVSP